MSLRRGYRSSGNWDSERSVFEFKDEFGQDPIVGRYGGGPGSQALAEARVARSASEVQLAQASLDAMTRPAKLMSDFFTTMNQAAEAKDNMLKRSRVSAQSIKLRERLNEANDYDSLTSLRADPELSDAFEDETIARQYDSKLRGLRARGIATLQNRLPKATSTSEIDGLVNEFSWLAGDQEAQTLINTFTPLAQRREAAVKGLMEAGAQVMPLTPTGELDVDRAERALSGTYTSSDINALQRREANITKRLADVELTDPDGEEAAQLRAQMSTVTDQLNAAAAQQERGSIMARKELESLGAGQKGWQAGFIYGEQPEEKPKETAAPATEPTPPAAGSNEPEPNRFSENNPYASSVSQAAQTTSTPKSVQSDRNMSRRKSQAPTLLKEVNSQIEAIDSYRVGRRQATAAEKAERWEKLNQRKKELEEILGS